jgi:hypothetical protein
MLNVRSLPAVPHVPLRQVEFKSDARFNPEALAAISRVFAREAAMKVAEDGMRWIVGADEINDGELAEFEKKLNLPVIHRMQVGLIADMDFVADVIYGRSKKLE